MARGISIKRRLMLLVLVVTLLVWLPVNLLTYRRAQAEIDDLWDIHLAQSAHLLMALVQAGAEHKDLEQAAELLPGLSLSHEQELPAVFRHFDVSSMKHRRPFVYQVLNPDGSVRLTSLYAPDQSLSQGVSGFSDNLVAGTSWRVYGVPNQKYGFVLYVGEDHAHRERLARQLADHLLLPMLLAIPLLLLSIWLAVGYGLAPLSRLMGDVRKRSHDNLQPLTATLVPTEVKPLVQALNSLFDRVERALENERQFTGNAAHELRTPLAALGVQAQVAKRATHDEQRRRALDQVIAGVAQAGHLIDQLLTLSRLDAKRGMMEEPVNLLDVARRTAADLASLASKSSVALRVEGLDALSPGDGTCLGILLRNLIDNAIRYTPAGGEVRVDVRPAGRYNRVTVEDTGPGIARGQHAEMFQRFRRGAETEAPGSGLGLSIVRRICELHRGSVRLENAKRGGLQCEVRLPLDVSDMVNAPRSKSDMPLKDFLSFGT